VKVKIYGNESDTLKSHSSRNMEQIKSGEYFPRFYSRYFVFQFATTCKEERNMQNAISFSVVWAWNLAPRPQVRHKLRVSENGAWRRLFGLTDRSNWKIRKLHDDLHNSAPSLNIIWWEWGFSQALFTSRNHSY